MTVEKSLPQQPIAVSEEVPPPSYAASSSASASTSASPAIARSNYVSINSPHNKFEGSFVIDPALNVSETMLGEMHDDEKKVQKRANLRINCTHSKLNVDVWVLDAPGLDVKNRTNWLVFDSMHGGAEVRLHSLGDVPSKITINTKHSGVKLQLPKGWEGLLTIKRRHVSTKNLLLPSDLCLISEMDGTLKAFVGDPTQLAGEEWTGNTLEIDVTHSKASIRIGDIEPVLATEKPPAPSSGNKLHKERDSEDKDGKDGKKKYKFSVWPAIGFVETKN